MSAASLGACSRVGAAFLSLALALSMSGGRADGRARGLEPQAARPALACPPSRVANGHDYRGLTLTLCSFSGQDLTNASFVGATLIGVLFIKTNLTNADFTDVTFADSGFAQLPTDFTFANLTRARFVGSKFNGLTYLTYATLSCADFSSPDSGTTDLSNGNAVFGDAPLDIDPKDCRPNFRGATMTCEFVAQWKLLDMSGATITGCTDQGKGQDFSGGNYSNVVFDGLDLSGSKWNGAVLEHASFQGATLDNATGLNGTSSQHSKLWATRFNNASMQNVDLSHAELYGAQFTNANLSNASFAGSFLGANTSATPPIETAAVFTGAHLRNVSFASAKLQSVNFRFASLYGTRATASGADLTGADFSNAYLHGVDFGGATTTINGTKFGSAILVGAKFGSAQFQVDGGAAPDFTKALLQGATFDPNADLASTGLLDAFVDFGAAGNPDSFNTVYLLLTSDYTGFRGWTGSKTPCVKLAYRSFTTVPRDASMTCPSGKLTICGAGDSPASLANWKSAIAMANNASVPGWYHHDATYDDAAPTASICGNNATVDPKW